MRFSFLLLLLLAGVLAVMFNRSPPPARRRWRARRRLPALYLPEAWLGLLLPLCCAGCLVESPTAEQTAAQFLEAAPEFDATAATAEPAPESPPAAAAAQQPAAALPAQKAEPRGYTGAIVFGDPTVCEPCRQLDRDIWNELRKRGWSVAARGSPDCKGTEDWIFAVPEQRHTRVPTVEFYRAGKLVDTHTGYFTGEASDIERRELLGVIVAKHPNSKAAEIAELKTAATQ